MDSGFECSETDLRWVAALKRAVPRFAKAMELVGFGNPEAATLHAVTAARMDGAEEMRSRVVAYLQERARECEDARQLALVRGFIDTAKTARKHRNRLEGMAVEVAGIPTPAAEPGWQP
jgi:hypothetical protein